MKSRLEPGYDNERLPSRLPPPQTHSEKPWRLQRRDRRSRRPASLETLTLDDIADPEYLLEIYDQYSLRPCPAAGFDGVRLDMVSRREFAEILRDVSPVIRRGEYHPSPARHVPIPKRGGGRRLLAIRSVLNSVVAKAVAAPIVEHMESVYLPGSHGFRRGRGAWSALAALLHVIEKEDCHVLVHDDVRRAFDSVRISLVVEDFARHITDPPLLRFVEVLLRGNENLNRIHGIDTGCPLSPEALNVHLHHRLDVSQEAVEGPHWLRYVDNLVYLGRSVSEVRACINHAQRALQAVGLELKYQGKQTVELTKGGHLPFLGYEIQEEDGQIIIGLTEDTWGRLAQGLQRTHGEPQPAQRAREVLEGWLTAAGPALERLEERPFTDRVLSLAGRYGFREISRRDVIRSALAAIERWRAYLVAYYRVPGYQRTSQLVAPPTIDAAGQAFLPEAWVAGETVPGDLGCPF